MRRGCKTSYFAYDLRWFCIVDCFQILLHCSIIVTLLVQVISILPKDRIPLGIVDAGLLSKIDG